MPNGRETPEEETPREPTSWKNKKGNIHKDAESDVAKVNFRKWCIKGKFKKKNDERRTFSSSLSPFDSVEWRKLTSKGNRAKLRMFGENEQRKGWNRNKEKIFEHTRGRIKEYNLSFTNTANYAAFDKFWWILKLCLIALGIASHTA